MLGRAEPMLVWLVLLLPPLLSVVPAVDSEAGTEAEPGTGPLTRRKRYVVFPEGSSFSIALCMTVHTLTPDNIFTEGLNWGISYDLPNESKPELAPLLRPRDDAPGYGAAEPGQWDAHGKYYLMPGAKKYYRADHHYLQRRHRRDLYGKLEVVIDAPTTARPTDRDEGKIGRGNYFYFRAVRASSPNGSPQLTPTHFVAGWASTGGAACSGRFARPRSASCLEATASSRR
ncbi:uncharacterized protein LOC131664956 isoform X2 [Phymastichus coffea]|uniref:uncharacterized protein LOC131664956 isoform X2 n=1 Tax=Phymastichus coffea TaxID=108790 RepID=UPI00273A9F18|nr:uncharacterized protein LOC131664956 isoform X2 [Phymastichus coffea]